MVEQSGWSALGLFGAIAGTLSHFVGGNAPRGLLGELTPVQADSKLLKLRCRGSSLVERRPENPSIYLPNRALAD